MNAKQALAKSMKEQNYDPEFAGGVLKMLAMNGFEIVETKQLDQMIVNYQNGAHAVRQAIIRISETGIERHIR